MTPPPADDYVINQVRKILVVDDDEGIQTLLEKVLRRAGYDVWMAFSAEQGLEVIRKRGLPHLAVVDIMMPGQGGFEFCEAIHAFSDLPVIMLTAVSTRDSVVRGLRHHAEDYITKPFDLRELTARIERVLRRIGDFSYAAEPVIEVDERLSVDFPRQRAIVSGEPTDLTPTESRLLYILMRNPGRVTPTDYLLRRLWPFKDSSAEALRVHVHRLRSKIEPEPSDPCYIVTERGRGYLFRPRTQQNVAR